MHRSLARSNQRASFDVFQTLDVDVPLSMDQGYGRGVLSIRNERARYSVRNKSSKAFPVRDGVTRAVGSNLAAKMEVSPLT